MPRIDDVVWPDGKYGVKLDRISGPVHFDISWVKRPSVEDIREAIEDLPYPEEVSHRTLEVILSMKWVPTCAYLELLLGQNPGVFTSCIGLLRSYCQTGRRIFDDTFGVLCLELISLCLDVAKLDQNNHFDDMLSTLLTLPDNQSICGVLDEYARHVETMISFDGDNIRSNKHKEGFGWFRRHASDDFACLPTVGGCQLQDIHFLMEQMWLARKEMLRASRWAANTLSARGWGGLIYAAWHIMVENTVRTNSTNTGGNTPEERRCWSQFIEIMNRYAFHSTEMEDYVLRRYVDAFPDSMAMLPTEEPQITAVDDEDSDQITSAYLAKINSRPRLDNDLFLTLLGYTCANVNASNFENEFPRVIIQTFNRAWTELLHAHELDIVEWQTFAECSANIIAVFMGLWKQPDSKRIQIILAMASDVHLFEYFGRLVLFPLSPLGDPIVERTSEWHDAHEHIQGMMRTFGKVLKERLATTRLKLSEDLFPVVHKVFNCFGQHRFLSRTLCRQRYSKDWESAWLYMSKALDLYSESLPAIQCAYPRCPIPNNAIGWECTGCDLKHYCSQKCRQADWLNPMKPHKAECRGLRGSVLP